MFTLKFYKRYPVSEGHPSPAFALHGPWSTEIKETNRVQVTKIAENTVEVRAIDASGHYESFYVGERMPEMDAITDDNHFDWGLLENRDGKTTEHFRPYGYS